MENRDPLFCHFFFLFYVFSAAAATSFNRQVYIVYCGEHSGLKTEEAIREDHHSLLLSVKDGVEEARDSILYSYKNSINGFAAWLTPVEAARLSEVEEVVSAFPSQARTMHTTRSWDFLGMENELYGTTKGILNKAKQGKNVIVGLLDSGIWPESESFSNQGMGPIPKRWKGICQEGQAFNSSHCNKKLIGARYYLKAYEAQYGRLNTTAEFRSPRDHDGHGTHTSSTAVGQSVHGVSALGGFAFGTASGGAPRARVAMYKVCWPLPGGDPALENTCFEADMLAAIDDALADGVDILSISIGTTGKQPTYSNDGIALGALHAMKKNVLVACSAGNSGPTPATASNLAPWILTVAASSIDRLFPSPVVLGNGVVVKGQTITSFKLKKRFYPIVFAANAVVPGTPKNISAGQCLPNSLDPKKVEGKIVFCLRGNGARVGKGFEVKRAGGAALILGNLPTNGAEISVDAHVLPGTALISTDATSILHYLNSSKNPTAKIIPATTVNGYKPAPVMAAFSSTGPNVLDPNILKPDITAPGLNILAAWSKASSPTKLAADKRRVKYNVLSGTSMSCPHVAGVAALLKAIHPRWSASVIKSALMTTASLTNNMGKPLEDASGSPAGPFNYGSGHLNPAMAADPGLVYDASYIDYLVFLCKSGIKIDRSYTCPKSPPNPSDLNLASVTISKLKGTKTVTRTVTNVGAKKALYSLSLASPNGVLVDIEPKELYFRRDGEKKSFSLTFKVGPRVPRSMKNGSYSFGWYMWSDGMHKVRSPIVVSLAN
ncbi:subtilisin-like protease SBT5.6 [Amborella trichopoda]|uniref:subtilisin-like protease SBT5.6 n=1 Tax=Amborella trichopoda TaxID=13333 RepID=UPI0009BD8293|nr:subtilisin-like protease SBT5.6 [Amborella trichopoda]|eukprot:XP_020532051.1 subtilisin-like protease SBT5.6 [Amborella trichopoda]